MLHFIIVGSLLFQYVVCSGVAIQTGSGSSVLDDQSQQKNLGTYGINSERGNAGMRYAAGFSQESDKKHALAKDTGGYNNVNNDRNSHENAQQFFGEQAQRENAGSTAQFGREGGHKKGHRKSGFQNSYHKEESENKSSFYDDADDHGGHFVYNSQDGGYHQAAVDRNQGARQDGHLYANDNAQKGGFDKAANFDRQQANKQGYNNNGFYNDYQAHGLQNAGNAQGVAGRHEENGYYNNFHQPPLPPQQPPIQPPPIQHPPIQHPPIQHPPIQPPPIQHPPIQHPPVQHTPIQPPQQYYKYAPRRTITIYEDPRDVYPPPQYRGYEPYNSNVQLNFRPNPYQYYPHYYDGYYYR